MKKIGTITLIFFCLFGSITQAYAQKKIDAKQSTESISNKIDNYIEERKDYTASVSVAVVDGQETLAEKYYGHEDIENKRKATTNTVYEWGSASKLLVWTSIMQLKEMGKLDLDEDIKTYLPENFLTKLKYPEKITILNLMNHNAGFQEQVYGNGETTEKSEIMNLEEALKATQPSQIYKPGEICSYSNWGSALAAYIVECVSGKEFYKYVNQYIFKPLDMHHTSAKTDRSDNAWVEKKREDLKAYSIYEDGYEKFGKALVYVQLYPAGATAGTLSDFTKFLKALIPDDNGSSPLFETSDTLSEMYSPTMTFEDTEISRISHGLWSLPYGDGVIGHSGNTQACTSSLFFDPITKKGMVVMTNEANETSYNYGLFEEVFGKYKKEKKNFKVYQNIKGIYTSPRINIAHGVYKINKFLSFSWWSQKNPTTYNFAGMLKRRQIDNNLFITDNENGMQTLAVPKTHETKVSSIETYTQDDQKLSTFSFFAHIILILIFLMAVIFHLGSLLYNIVFRLIKGLFKKTKKRNTFSIIYLVSNVSTIVISVLVYSVILKPGNIYYLPTAIKCSIIILCTVTLLITILLRIKKYEKISFKRSEIIWVFLTFFTIINVIYWEWFNFWSF